MTVVGRVDANRRERYVKRQLERARDLLDSGDAGQTVDVLESLAEQHPDDADLWLELSYASRLCGNDDAVDHARKANELAPTDSRTYGELALALSQDAERLDEAIGVIEQGLALDDGEALNWAVLGTLRLATDERVGASLACERALAIDPACVEAHFVLGDAAVAFGALDEAAERYRHVLELAPELDAAAAALEWVEHQLPTTQTAANPASTAADEASEPSPAPRGGRRAEESDTPSSEYGPSMTGADVHGFEPASEHEALAANGSGSAAGSQGARLDSPRNGAGPTVANRAVLDAIVRHLDAYNRRDIDSLLDGFSEDAVLRTADERIVGREALRDVFAGAFDAPEQTELVLRSTIVENGSAACELTERFRDDDGEYESEFVGLYTVLAGRIVRARLYYDSG